MNLLFKEPKTVSNNTKSWNEEAFFEKAEELLFFRLHEWILYISTQKQSFSEG